VITLAELGPITLAELAAITSGELTPITYPGLQQTVAVTFTELV
jgi:hypothetical protein